MDMKELYKNDPGALMMMAGVKEIMINAKISELESLLGYSEFEGFTTAKQFSDKIKSNLNLFNKMKLEKGMK